MRASSRKKTYRWAGLLDILNSNRIAQINDRCDKGSADVCSYNPSSVYIIHKETSWTHPRLKEHCDPRLKALSKAPHHLSILLPFYPPQRRYHLNDQYELSIFDSCPACTVGLAEIREEENNHHLCVAQEVRWSDDSCQAMDHDERGGEGESSGGGESEEGFVEGLGVSGRQSEE
jgi:hypothetical protein